MIRVAQLKSKAAIFITGRVAVASKRAMVKKKNFILLAVLVVLVAAYAYFFTNWFQPKRIEVFSVSRTVMRGGPRVKAGNANTMMVLFGLNDRYKLTEIKVVPLDELKTNPLALPVWHLVSDSNSVPVKEFPYGVAIRGMRPLVGNEFPNPLEANQTYRIFVVAGTLKGQHDFTALPKPAGK